MRTVQKPSVGKNELWTAYENALPLQQDEILLELKKAGLYQHFYKVATVEGYDLKKDHKGRLRDAFMKVLPETAPLFGIDLAYL